MPQDAALAITVDGNSYTIRFSDLTAEDAKDFRTAVGISLAEVITKESADLDVIAGLVWLARRKRERGLPYKKVAQSINYETNIDLAEPEAEKTDDPEA